MHLPGSLKVVFPESTQECWHKDAVLTKKVEEAAGIYPRLFHPNPRINGEKRIVGAYAAVLMRASCRVVHWVTTQPATA